MTASRLEALRALDMQATVDREEFRRTEATVRTIGVFPQRVATHGNGFRLFPPLSRRSDLPPVATGCARWAP
jgi:hypothetical protein